MHLQFHFYPLTLVLQMVYHEFHHQLVDVLSDRDTHHSIVSKLHTRAVISQEVMVAQKTQSSTAGSDRGSSLLTVLGLEEKPHKLKELITAMMEEGKVQSLAEEMAALLSKTEQGIPTDQLSAQYGVSALINPRPEGYGSLFVIHSFCLSTALQRAVLTSRQLRYEQAKHVDGLQCDSWILLKCFRSRVMAGSP